MASAPGRSISRSAAAVEMSTHLAYSGSTPSLPSRRPGISRNWRRTSSIISLAARPTALIVSEANRNGQHRTEEQADEHLDPTEVEVERCAAGSDDGGLEGLEQGQRGEGGGADGEALGHRGGGVAERVEAVGDLAHLGRQVGHLGDAAGVVGDRPVGVDRHDDAGGGEHADGGAGDAVDAEALGRLLAAPVGHADADARRATTEAATEIMPAEMPPRIVVAGTGLGLGGDLLHRAVLVGGPDLGDLADGVADEQAADDADRQAPPVARPRRCRRTST